MGILETVKSNDYEMVIVTLNHIIVHKWITLEDYLYHCANKWFLDKNIILKTIMEHWKCSYYKPLQINQILTSNNL